MRDLTPSNGEDLAHLNAGLKCLTQLLWETHLLWEQRESAARTIERTRAIACELMAKAWHPRRFMLSCLDIDELAELHRDGWVA